MAAPNYGYNQQQPAQQTPQQQETTSRVTMKYQGDDGFSFKKYLALGGIALVVILVGGFLWNWVNSPMLVTVSGTGEISAPVDSATVSFVLSSSAGTSSEVISSVESKAQGITTLLSAQGIADEDIAQSQVNVVPASTLVEGATGYQASITMGAKTVHVSDVDGLINLLYSNGASLVSQPVVSIEDREALEDQALADAMREAKEDAKEIGRKNLKFIRKIVAVSQSTPTSTSTVTTRPDALTGSNQPESLNTGVIKVRQTVTVSYKMW